MELSLDGMLSSLCSRVCVCVCGEDRSRRKEATEENEEEKKKKKTNPLSRIQQLDINLQTRCFNMHTSY